MPELRPPGSVPVLEKYTTSLRCRPCSVCVIRSDDASAVIDTASCAVLMRNWSWIADPVGGFFEKSTVALTLCPGCTIGHGLPTFAPTSRSSELLGEFAASCLQFLGLYPFCNPLDLIMLLLVFDNCLLIFFEVVTCKNLLDSRY